MKERCISCINFISKFKLPSIVYTTYCIQLSIQFLGLQKAYIWKICLIVVFHQSSNHKYNRARIKRILVMQWLGHWASTAEGMGSVPGWELGSHAVWSSKNKNKNKNKNKKKTLQSQKLNTNSSRFSCWSSSCHFISV